jgi:hypothetical protein
MMCSTNKLPIIGRLRSIQAQSRFTAARPS